MTRKNNALIVRLILVSLIFAIIASTMTGCGTAGNHVPYEKYDAEVEYTETQNAIENSEEDAADSAVVEQPVYDDTEPDIDPGKLEKPAPAMNSVEAIAGIGDLVGNYSIYSSIHAATVDIDNDHNPYDLTWTYGENPSADMLTPEKKWAIVSDPEWHAVYDSYVAACDWSLVFDADYYAAQFPMLAYLYQNDEDLLLEHFQTVGVHEGRQGIDSFNVAAYALHCDQALVDAFGNNYECYYFYWMLNQGTEKSIVTTDSKAPTWLTVQLTYYQAEEYKNINDYRVKAGVDAVALDPEMVAFANYRAWYDAKYAIKAHDSIYEKGVDYAMDALDIDRFYENTCKYQYPNSIGKTELTHPYSDYYNSTKGHRENMLDPGHEYTGVSNCYLSEYTRRTLTQFDMFTPKTPVTSR